MNTSLKLAEIISARLCHDLAGPIGTLSASLEMAADDSVDVKEALEIAADAARALQSRLRFIRMAWAVDGAARDAGQIVAACSALPQARKIAFEAQALAGVFTPPMARALLNLAMLAIEALPRGGTVSLAGNDQDGVVATLRGRGAAWPPGLAALCTPQADAWEALHDSRTLQAPLTALILQASGLRMRFLMGGGEEEAPLPLMVGRP